MSSKRKRSEDLYPAKKKKAFTNTSTEDISLRFPHLRDGIFDQLGDKNLAKCKEISRIWCQMLETEKFNHFQDRSKSQRHQTKKKSR